MLDLPLKLFLQMPHLYGFSLVWISWCTSRWFLRLNSFPQKVHGYRTGMIHVHVSVQVVFPQIGSLTAGKFTWKTGSFLSAVHGRNVFSQRVGWREDSVANSARGTFLGMDGSHVTGKSYGIFRNVATNLRKRNIFFINNVLILKSTCSCLNSKFSKVHGNDNLKKSKVSFKY